MPGAYAHITAVNVARDRTALEAAGVPPECLKALLKHVGFCELGAVSPDYPYLDLLSSESKRWADLMHYERTGDLVLALVSLVRDTTGPARSKAIAWVLGYLAHVTMDMTIHPVVELKVGPYEQNQGAHRECEMHQDAFIYPRLNLGAIDETEHLRSGIGRCGAPGDDDRLDPDIAGIWMRGLQQVHGVQTTDSAPAMDRWHRRFRLVVDRGAEEGSWLPAFARHVAAGLGLTYPRPDEVNSEFIEQLETPWGAMHYDALFDRGVANVRSMWRKAGLAITEGMQHLDGVLGEWNLDTGRDPSGDLVMWRRS